MLKRLNQYLESMVEVPRIRIGKRQTIETLINEEALLLAKFLRGERETWTPRMANHSSICDEVELRILPKKEELPYLFSILITSLGLLYNLVTVSIPNTLILLGLDVLLGMAWQRDKMISSIDSSLKKEEEIFVDRGKLGRLADRLDESRSSLWIMAETFTTLIGVNDQLLVRRYNDGCEIKILLLNPNIVKGKMLSKLDEPDLRKHLELSIRWLEKYRDKKSQKGGTITGRLLPFETGFGLFIIDGEEPSGKIKAELMLKNIDPDEWPNVIITRKDTRRYEQLLKHFEELWELSDPIPIFTDDFVSEKTGSTPSEWNVVKGKGKVEVNVGSGARGTRKFVTISSPKDSNDYIQTVIKPHTRVVASYHIRQEQYAENGLGAAFLMCSAAERAVWLGIRFRTLQYHDGRGYRGIGKISEGQWYEIRVEADCSTNTFDCYLDGELALSKGKFMEAVDSIDSLKSTAWVNQPFWSTSIDQVEIVAS